MKTYNKSLLAYAAIAWFFVALAGQWMFAAYTGLYFGGRLTESGLPGLGDTHLQGGYVGGDVVGNLLLAAHVIVALVIHGFGPLQLVPWIRQKAPALHRFFGRAFLIGVLIAALSGLYIIWVKGTREGPEADITNTIDSALIMVFGYLALRNAIAGKITIHRRWALRLFIAASAVWFVRLQIYGTIVICDMLDIEFRPLYTTVFAVAHIGKLLFPLGILELYLWAKDSGNERAKLLVGLLLIVATVATAIGIWGAATLGWLPKLAG